MTRPKWRSCMPGRAAWTSVSAAPRWSWLRAAISSAVVCSIRLGRMMPALWTTCEIACRTATSFAASAVAFGSSRSTKTGSSFACDQSGLRRSSDTTWWPASSIASAMARPMPPLAPVTMATSLWLMFSPGFLHRPLLQRPCIDATFGADGRGDQFFQRTALDLLRRGQRHRLDERDIAGGLVVGEPAQAPSDDIGRDLLARGGVRRDSVAHHAGKDFVAAHRIRGRRHRDLPDG